MKRVVALLAAVGAAPAFAQTPQVPPPPAVEIAGSLTPGVQQLDNTANSSKLTEYRDLRDDFYLERVTFSARDRGTGWFFDLSGANVSRNDQSILAEGGRPGVWNVQARWVGVPHNFSNKAVSPYIRRGPGLFEVPGTAPITFKKLATSAADAPAVAASDAIIAAYQTASLAPTTLGTRTNAGRFALAWAGSDAVTLAVAYDRRLKSGLKPTFGPIGDRPPRTLNIQITEPIDYRTDDLTLSAEHEGRGYQVRVAYLFSDFANRIDTLQWQNAYTTAAPGATYDVWDRAVSVYGRRPLPPDNRYHNISATFGRDLPLASHLSATAVYGRLEQNETLLPYSYNTDLLSVAAPPRTTASASMTMTQWLADYVINPFRRLTVRAWARHYGLDNDTPEDRWQYVTSDTSNLNGTVSYKNRRVSLAYASDRTNVGVDAIHRLPARTTFSLGYEREDIDRDYREADTAENRVTATLRTRAARWMNVRARYVFGNRDGDGYDGQVTRQSYWYARADAGTDNDNPAYTFSNHPDMRRSDVSDRRRRQVDLTLNVTPRDVVALSAYVRYRKDDFDSDVAPSQPLLGTGLPQATATSPGDQLGLLEDARLRYGMDVFVQPNPRVALNAFLTYDKGTSFQRSLEFNENNKQNPGAIATAELGPWTRAASQWTADFNDRTWGAGAGATLQLVPDRLTFVADYTASLAAVDIAYGGFGVTNFDGTPFPPNHQFAFSSPPTITEDFHLLNLRLEIPTKAVTLVVGYTFETYELDDWQQGSTLPWVEPVGSDTLLRDTSRSHQWGNRLFNLGTYLAPSYDAHIGFVGFTYRF